MEIKIYDPNAPDGKKRVSEGSTNVPDKQPQSLEGCMALREECQSKIFAHIDDRHDKVMATLGSIDKKISYEEGRRNGAAETQGNKPVKDKEKRKFPWREVAAAVVITTAAIATALIGVKSILSETPKADPTSVHSNP